jgi:hypothetical protein
VDIPYLLSESSALWERALGRGNRAHLTQLLRSSGKCAFKSEIHEVLATGLPRTSHQ